MSVCQDALIPICSVLSCLRTSALRPAAADLCVIDDTAHNYWAPTLACSSVSLSEGPRKQGFQALAHPESHKIWVGQLVMSSPQPYDMRIILRNRSSPWPSWTGWVVSSKHQNTECSHIHIKKLSLLVPAERKVLPIKLALTLKDRSAFKLANTFWHSSLACMLLQKCLLG